MAARSRWQLVAAAAVALSTAAAVWLVSLNHSLNGGLLVTVWSMTLVPVAVTMLLLSWVQPRDDDYPLTVVLGLVLAPLVAWFAGRADEFLGEALVSGGLIAVVVWALIVIRRRGGYRLTTDYRSNPAPP